MDENPIYLETRGEIAIMVLNRPAKLNALNRQIWRKIPELCAAVATDKKIKVLILRGVNSDAFSAGADIAEFPEVHATAAAAQAYPEEIHTAYDAIAGLEKPTIAMVQGICFGGGCALTLCSDIRYADLSAKFCIPPSRLGIAYSLAETKRLADLVGPSKTMEMLFAAKVIEAREALQTGLATRLFEAEELEAETFAFAEELCRLSQFSIRTIKAVVHEIVGGARQESAGLAETILKGFEGEDHIEGRDAFLAKRKPNFTYR